MSSVRALREHGDAFRLAVMFFLFFLVVTTVGILRPVRNVLALDGLADTEFYKTYFVSALVVLFAPIYNRVANRVAWRVLIPSVAFFFAASFVVFRLMYREGSALFGMAFYGWYDLYAAALVTQFFIATQLFFNAREAKKAYPLVIAGGSIGATLGGGLVGFFSERLGTPNMLLVAAAIVTLFGISLFVLWLSEDPEDARRLARERLREKDLATGEFRRIFSNPHVQLIAAAVLATVLVKQLVDYSFNTAIEVTIGDRDAMGEFQGFFMAATQWTPILVLAALRPLLSRWGVGIAVFMLPVVMLITNSAVALSWGLWTAVVAKGADATFRYSAERTGREILYVPVPEEIKLKAKAWIDVGVEKGVGKASSALLLMGLVAVMDYRKVAFVAVGLSVVSLLVAYRVRREYVNSLRQSIEGRFASLEGVYASIIGASTLPMIREALGGEDPLRIAFALDLVDHAGSDDIEKVSGELHELLSHAEPEIRLRALGLLSSVPKLVDAETVRGRLFDVDPRVREAAVRALAAAAAGEPERVCRELLEMSDARVRAATLACLARDMSADRAEEIVRPFFEERLPGFETADEARRLELAVAAAVMATHSETPRVLETLFGDPNPRVASAALRSAGNLEDDRYYPALIDALGDPDTRFAAREALTAQGKRALDQLTERLNDEMAEPRVRRNIPPVLAGIPAQETVAALIHSYDLKETDQLLDNRSLKALSRLRTRHDELQFDEDVVLDLLGREITTAGVYSEALAAVHGLEDGDRKSARLLERALREARRDRRRSAFRWLSLIFPPDDMYRSYLALRSGDSRSRANALEWLETTVGHALYQRLAPVVERGEGEDRASRDRRDALRRLWDDEDHWIARCSMWAMADLGFDGVAEEIRRWRPDDPAAQTLARRLTDRLREDGDGLAASIPRKGDMDLIEKVFLLQNVDLLQGAGSAQLALLASIAEEVEADEGEVLLERGDPTDALYVVIRGRVVLHGVADQSLTVENGSPFGTWALIDDEPSLVEARAVESTRLLRISRRDFDDLLADYPELGLDLLQGLARRVRSLAGT